MANSLFDDPRYFETNDNPLPQGDNLEDVPEADDRLHTDDGSYLACRITGNPPTRLRIIDREGAVSLPRYNFMDDVVLLGQEWLALVFTHYVLVLHGRNLHALLDPLQDERLRWLMCFDDRRHLPPTDPDAPLILSIDRYAHQDFLPLILGSEEAEDDV